MAVAAAGKKAATKASAKKDVGDVVPKITMKPASEYFAKINFDEIGKNADGTPNFEKVTAWDNLHSIQIFNLIIRAAAKELGLACTFKQFAITGHVDTGKSSLTATACANSAEDPLLIELNGKIAAYEKNAYLTNMKKLKEDSEGVEREKGTIPNIATFVEKGKEAKERAITIETKSHLFMCKVFIQAKAGSKEYETAVEKLNYLGQKFKEEDVTVAGEACKKITTFQECHLIDCPGHQDYQSGTAAAMALCFFQFTNFQLSAAEDLLTFSNSASICPTSMSYDHGNFGLAHGLQQVFLGTKSDTCSSSKVLTEQVNDIYRHITKNIGKPRGTFGVIPVACNNFFAHNFIDKYGDGSNENLKEWNGCQFEMTQKHIGSDKTFKHQCFLEYATQILSWKLETICLPSAEGRGCCVRTTGFLKTSGGIIMLGVVLEGCPSLGESKYGTGGDKGVLSLNSTLLPNAGKIQITSFECYNKAMLSVPVKAHFGAKFKPGPIGNAKKVHDLLHTGYKPEIAPKASTLFLVKGNMKQAIKGHKPKTKEDQYLFNIGHNHVVVSGSKVSFSVAYIHSVSTKIKTEKGYETHTEKSTPDKPLMGHNGGIVEMVLKTNNEKEIAMPTMNDCSVETICQVLDHNSSIGLVKIMKPLDEAEVRKNKQDLLYQRQVDLEAKKAANKPGKKK